MTAESSMRKGFDNIAVIIATYATKNGNEKAIGLILNLSSIASILSALYEFLIRTDGVAKIETLPDKRKQYYRDLTAGKFTDRDKRFKAIKAIYVFELITSS